MGEILKSKLDIMGSLIVSKGNISDNSNTHLILPQSIGFTPTINFYFSHCKTCDRKINLAFIGNYVECRLCGCIFCDDCAEEEIKNGVKLKMKPRVCVKQEVASLDYALKYCSSCLEKGEERFQKLVNPIMIVVTPPTDLHH